VNEKVFAIILSGFVNLKGYDESTMEDVLLQDDLAKELIHHIILNNKD